MSKNFQQSYVIKVPSLNTSINTPKLLNTEEMKLLYFSTKNKKKSLFKRVRSKTIHIFHIATDLQCRQNCLKVEFV